MLNLKMICSRGIATFFWEHEDSYEQQGQIPIVLIETLYKTLAKKGVRLIGNGGNFLMVITDFLEQNAQKFSDDVALVEIVPNIISQARTTWKEYSLIPTNSEESGRCEITWCEFNKKANRFANLLLSRGVKKGDKVAILLMNCLEWLPIYFGALNRCIGGTFKLPLHFR